MAELLDPDGGLALVSKLVYPAGVVGVVFEDRNVERGQSQPPAAADPTLPFEELAGDLVVLVVESKGPDDEVEVAAAPEDIDDSQVELPILHLPKDVLDVEHFRVEYVLGLEEAEDFSVVARA